MLHRDGQLLIKQTPNPHILDPKQTHTHPTPYPPAPWTPTTPWQSFVYSFGYYSMKMTTWSYRMDNNHNHVSYQCKTCADKKEISDTNVHDQSFGSIT